MLDTESKGPAKLVPVTNTALPSRATDTALAKSPLLVGPLKRATHSCVPSEAR